MLYVGDEQHYTQDEKIASWLDEWTFKGANIGTYTHKIHRYPAMFIPQLVRKLILEYSDVGDTVLDIFNGSGSTMVEALLTGRHGVGIEINPLANLIAKVKTTPLDKDDILTSFAELKEFYFSSQAVNNVSFEKIEFWFSESVIEHLSKLKFAISRVDCEDLVDFFNICMSENIRELSVCRHSGFKMHRDPKKVDKQFSASEVFARFEKSVRKNCAAVVGFADAYKNFPVERSLINASSVEKHDIDLVDMILTSPPYGDSRTTVAYGQFSRLCSEWLDLGLEGLPKIGNLDGRLLGGAKIDNKSISEVASMSPTLFSALAYYDAVLAGIDETSAEHKKMCARINDVASFYVDLNKTIQNAASYLKKNKHFILVTGSRVVKMYKLHTDIICAELAENHGFRLSTIFYRNIENKRMPRAVSATNIVGEKAPTMTKESIVVLKKI